MSSQDRPTEPDDPGPPPKPPPVDMDALRVIYQAAGRLTLDPDLFPPTGLGLVEALNSVTGRLDRGGPELRAEPERAGRRALYLDALMALAGQDKKLPTFDGWLDTYRAYAANLAPSMDELVRDQFRRLVDDDGTFDPQAVLDSLHDDHSEFAESLRDVLQLFGKGVCNIGLVSIDGKQAVAIYSELTTEHSVAQLVAWVDPRKWDTWGPALFKEMSVQQPPPESPVLPPPGLEGYTASFREHVDLYGHDLRNELACAYSMGDDVVAMTYDLVDSQGNEVTVDRGFLSATSIDAQRSRLRVLKIIGFSNPGLQAAMLASCPLWTDFIGYAANHADDIVHGREPAPQTWIDVICGMLRDDWAKLVCSTTNDYSQLALELWQEAPTAWSTPGAVVQSGRKLVHQVAQDWAQWWQSSNRVIDALAGGGPTATAKAGGPVGFAAPPSAPPVGRDTTASGTGSGASTIIRVTVPPGPGTVTLGADQFLAIDGTRAYIPGSAVAFTPSMLAGGEDQDVTMTLRLLCDQIGFYVGTLNVGTTATMPVSLYVSGAVKSGA